VDRNSLSLG